MYDQPYMVDYIPRKLPFMGPKDECGIPMFDPSKSGFLSSSEVCYHPIVIIQYALAQYDVMLSSNDMDQASFAKMEFVRCARWLQDNAKAESACRFVHWPYSFSLRTPRLKPPWSSGMAQGQAASVLARLHSIEPSDAILLLVGRTLAAFEYSVSNGGMITIDEDHQSIFIEEVAAKPVLSILNGCLYALRGIIDVVDIMGLDKYSSMVERCVKGVEARLPRFDTGSWSRYSLGLRFHLAPDYYHLVHIKQLAHLGHVTGSTMMLEYSSRWQEYFDSAVNRKWQAVRRTVQLNFNRVLTLTRLDRIKYVDV